MFDSESFHHGLVAHGLILPTGIRGGYGRGAQFERVLRGFNELVSRIGAPDGAEEMCFPPIVARALIEKVGYMESFPHLAGSVHSFFGDETQARELGARMLAGERWEELLDITEVMLTPAACYPVYPMFGGLLPEGGRVVTVLNWVYRHEPSDESTRLQSFRMREYIRAGRSDQVVAWRDAWLLRALDLLRNLGLDARSDVAADPFFGRAGKMLAANQVDRRLKFEILVPVISAENPTAICSFNWHQDHFSGTFGIRNADGSLASTACLGFGLERVTLALIRTHGFDPQRWPAHVRAQLSL